MCVPKGTVLLRQAGPKYKLDTSRALLQLQLASEVHSMEEVGNFCIKVGQVRRRLKNVFEQLDGIFSRKKSLQVVLPSDARANLHASTRSHSLNFQLMPANV